eukprot:c24848_g1_i2 orf=38-1024(+)
MAAATGAPAGGGDDDGGREMEIEAFRRLYPLQFIERFLAENIRPDARRLDRARPTSLSLGTVPTADGSALVKIGNTTMLAGVKVEVMTPAAEFPDQGRIVIDFQMPPICSPLVRPGRPAEEASVISEQLSNALTSSGIVDLRELSIAAGKAAWMAYLDVYCLDADGSLLDAALFASVGALANLDIPMVSVTEEGKVVPASASTERQVSHATKDSVLSSNGAQRRQLKLRKMPVALTCALYKRYLLVDPTAEEELVLRTIITVILDSSGHLISFYKPGGEAVAMTSTVMDCIAKSKYRMQELQNIFEEAIVMHAAGRVISMDMDGACVR